MSKNFCASSPSASASAKASLVAIIEMPSSMLLQIFAACPVPLSPARMMAFAIGFSAASISGKSCSRQPTMKVSVPPVAAAVPPETGASAARKALHRRIARNGAGGVDVDRRAIDQQRVLRRVREHCFQIDIAHVLAGGQHGYDDIGILARIASTRRRRHALLLGAVQRIGAEVEGDNLVARFGLIGGHARAHVTKTDECDAGHESSSYGPPAPRRPAPSAHVLALN
jgi:hypothetical protein